MKKTYCNPTLKIVKVQPAQFIANSIPVDPTKETSTQMGRQGRFSDWDEEDE